MLTSAVLAVALGLAPVNDDGSVDASHLNSPEVASKIGKYTESTNGRGTTHIKGHDARGRCYELVMDRHGHVEAEIDEQIVSFDISQRA
jgi:hypothetical protein